MRYLHHNGALQSLRGQYCPIPCHPFSSRIPQLLLSMYINTFYSYKMVYFTFNVKSLISYLGHHLNTFVGLKMTDSTSIPAIPKINFSNHCH
jgi:hypothetical protein